MTKEEVYERLNKGHDPLQLSIQKWKDIYKWLKSLKSITIGKRHLDKLHALSNGHRNCALCIVHCDDDCNGCPVMKETVMEFCLDTPYQQWADLRKLGANIEALATIAKDEINFLGGLS